MKYIKTYENHNNTTLIIVDVQKSFKKFFTEMYLNELKKYCQNFQNVYQIFDNHVDGKNVDKDYLYDDEPEIPIHDDLYHFPNQKDIIEKRYNYDVIEKNPNEYDVDKVLGKQILIHLQGFFNKPNNNVVTIKNKNTKKNTTRKNKK
jgi:hypothetical protein